MPAHMAFDGFIGMPEELSLRDVMDVDSLSISRSTSNSDAYMASPHISFPHSGLPVISQNAYEEFYLENSVYPALDMPTAPFKANASALDATLQPTDIPSDDLSQIYPLIANPSDMGFDTALPYQDPLHMSVDLAFGDVGQFSPQDAVLQNYWASQDMDQSRTMENGVSDETALSNTASPDQSASFSPVDSPHKGQDDSAKPKRTNEAREMASGREIPAEDAWPSFRCNPQPESLSTTNVNAHIYLEELRKVLKEPESWQGWCSPQWPFPEDGSCRCPPNIEPVGQRTRDKLMVITQSFLQRACEIQEPQDVKSKSKRKSRPVANFTHADFDDEAFLTLPSTEILDQLLHAYTCQYEPYYPLVSTATCSPTELMHSTNKKPASILLLLMFAAGAAKVSSKEGMTLTSGLIEVCRLLLFDMIDKDILLSRDPLVLRAVLLFVNLAAWSGDMWHMDFATSQLSMYLSVRIACPTNWSSLGLADGPQMLRHSGLLAYRELELPECDGEMPLKAIFEQWREHESLNRLVYTWVIVDQELSLFHDTSPNLSVTELTAALPDSDGLWYAKDAEDWARAVSDTYDGIPAHELESLPSLYSQFKRLMNKDIGKDDAELTPLQLRLLLHPLQALVCHLYQSLNPLSSSTTRRQAQRLLTQLDEAQSLLKYWRTLYKRTSDTLSGFSPEMCANLVMYHLIYLNTMIHFPDVEKLARNEVRHDGFLQSPWVRERFVDEAPRIWVHCGQVIRLYRQMPVSNRPQWWTASVYRVALTMWAACLSGAGYPSANNLAAGTDQIFLVDSLPTEHRATANFLHRKEGIPMLTKRSGGLTGLDSPTQLLAHCMEVLQEDESTLKLTDGLTTRLSRLIYRTQNIAM